VWVEGVAVHDGVLCRGGLRNNEKAINPGAQTERRGEAGPVTSLLGGRASPASFMLFSFSFAYSGWLHPDASVRLKPGCQASSRYDVRLVLKQRHREKYMARARSSRNGRLEELMANLLQNQAILQQNIATLVQTQAAFVARMSETDSRIADMDQRIERRFANIEAILSELVRMIERLPEAVRDKIGFSRL
jgi:hypothetical protein